MVREVTAFETQDGKRFSTLQEAQRHERYLQLVEELDRATCCSYDDAEEVAEYILKHYELTRKGT